MSSFSNRFFRFGFLLFEAELTQLSKQNLEVSRNMLGNFSVVLSSTKRKAALIFVRYNFINPPRTEIIFFSDVLEKFTTCSSGSLEFIHIYPFSSRLLATEILLFLYFWFLYVHSYLINIWHLLQQVAKQPPELRIVGIFCYASHRLWKLAFSVFL